MPQDHFRPETWAGFIGQSALKERLNIHIKSALSRDEPLDHLLLIGSPGCGKTTLAAIVAAELNQPMESYVMPIDQGLLMSIVGEFQGVLFLDEIHRSPRKQQETMLSLIEDGYMQNARGVRTYIEGLTIIAATTEPELVIAPLHQRFMLKPTFEEYDENEMAQVVAQMAAKADLEFTPSFSKRLGRAAGGTPRNARSLVLMTRDQLEVHGKTTVDEVLATIRVTHTGLTMDHVRYLNVLDRMGGIAGLDVLGSHLRLPKAILMDLERLFLAQGLITYTKGGRELDRRTYNRMFGHSRPQQQR